MTGNQKYEATFREFAKVLGYPYKGKRAHAGKRLHSIGVEPDKSKLIPLCIANGVPGQANHLLPLYNILLCVFCSNISPNEGNADVVRGGLVNLLAYAHEVFECGEHCDKDHKIDVMDLIFEELHLAVV